MKQYLLKLSDEKQRQMLIYITTVKKIIDYHKTHHYPALMKCQRNIIEICEVIKRALINEEFLEAYQTYAGHSYRAYKLLDEQFTDAPIKDFNLVPIVHLNRCNVFLGHLMYELKDADDLFVSDEFKAVAVTETMFNKFEQRVMDNLHLNSMKDHQKVCTLIRLAAGT